MTTQTRHDPARVAVARYILAADFHGKAARGANLERHVQASQIAQRAAKAELVNPEPTQ